MNKVKLFIENFLVYGFSGVIGKLIPLIMLPIITRLLPDSAAFGINDLFSTMVSFFSAIAIFGMYDAMYRMFFEKDSIEYKKEVCSTAGLFVGFSSFVVFVLMLLFRVPLSRLFWGSEQYAFLVLIAALAAMMSAVNAIVSAPTRMQNKRRVFVVTNTIAPVLSYSVAILLLLYGNQLTSLPLAALASGSMMVLIFSVLNRGWFSFQKFSPKLLRQMLVIAVPLMPNFLFYWVFNSCDRLMITNMIGIGESGIYAIGAKLGTASQLIYTAFAGGWQYFSFSTMHEDNQVKNNSLVFEYLGIISFSASMFVFALTEPFYRLLFSADYARGYLVSPYLFLAPLIQMLFQVIGNQFLVIKKTWPSTLILLYGALFNVLLNWFLIPRLGIEGAAIATLSGYTISAVIASVVLLRMRLMVISGRFLLSAAVMVLFILAWRFLLLQTVWMSLVLAIGCCLIFVLLYRKDLLQLIGKLKT